MNVDVLPCQMKLCGACCVRNRQQDAALVRDGCCKGDHGWGQTL